MPIYSGVYYSPEFKRGGPSASFSASASHVPRAGRLHVEVQHRDAPGDPWQLAGTVGTFTGRGSASAVLGRLKAVLRMKATAEGSEERFEGNLHQPRWFLD